MNFNVLLQCVEVREVQKDSTAISQVQIVPTQITAQLSLYNKEIKKRYFSYIDSTSGQLHCKSSKGMEESWRLEQSIEKLSFIDTRAHWHCDGQSAIVHSRS